MPSGDGPGPTRTPRNKRSRTDELGRPIRDSDYFERQRLRTMLNGIAVARELGTFNIPSSAPTALHMDHNAEHSTVSSGALATARAPRASRGSRLAAVDGEPALPKHCFNCGLDNHQRVDCELPFDSYYFGQWKLFMKEAQRRLATFRADYHAGKQGLQFPTLPDLPGPRVAPHPDTTTEPSIIASTLTTGAPITTPSVAPSLPITPLASQSNPTPPVAMAPISPATGPVPTSHRAGASEMKSWFDWVMAGVKDARLGLSSESKASFFTALRTALDANTNPTGLIQLCTEFAIQHRILFQRDAAVGTPAPWVKGHTWSDVPAFIRLEADMHGYLPTELPLAIERELSDGVKDISMSGI